MALTEQNPPLCRFKIFNIPKSGKMLTWHMKLTYVYKYCVLTCGQIFLMPWWSPVIMQGKKKHEEPN